MIGILKTKYKYEIVNPGTSGSNEIDTITLSSTNEALEIGGESATVTVNIKYKAGEGEDYYLVSDGKYYAITPSTKNGLDVANEPSDIDTSSSSTDRNETVTADSDNSNINAVVNGKTITISSESTTFIENAKVTIKVNNETFTNNVITVAVKQLSKLDSLNVSSLVLDGASLVTATILDGSNKKIATSNDVKWTTSDPEVATVTSNGIVKCGTKTGSATITCTGAKDATTNKPTVQTVSITSNAKIVYTNDGPSNDLANRTITGAKTGFAYNNPVIPVGFSAIDTVAAKWNLSNDKQSANPEYNNGLVIMDSKGNQFVWVPVGETVTEGETTTTPITYAKWDGTKTYKKVNDVEDDTLSDGTAINSIDKTTGTSGFGGFWIGRYEAGIDVDLGTNAQTGTSTYRSTEYAPIIVEGAIPWNYITYANSRKSAEKLYPSTNSYLRSALVNGTMWDTAIKFIQLKGEKNDDTNHLGVNSDSINWGNYKNSEFNLDNYKMYSEDYGVTWTSQNVTKKIKDNSQLIRTGAGKSTTEVLNISDMAGNLWEWTNEKVKNSSGLVCRGGSFDGSGSDCPAACRGSDSDGAGDDRRFQSWALYKVELMTDKGGLSS